LQQLFPDSRTLATQPFGGLVDFQPVDPGCALIGPHPFPCLLHVLSCQSCTEQPWPRALRFMTRTRGFVAAWIGQGFTLPYSGPLRQSGHLTHCPAHRHAVEHSFSFGPSLALRQATTASADFSLPAQHRRPFRRKARSPQVRTHSFAAQPPDLRRLPLVTRASRSRARSPWSATPFIRFLFIGPQLRSTLPPHTRSPSCSCASLRSL